MKSQKHYCIQFIVFLSFLLIIYPFLGMTEFIEDIYVALIGFFIAFFAIRLKFLMEGKVTENKTIGNIFSMIADRFTEKEEYNELKGEKKRKKISEVFKQGRYEEYEE